MHRLTVAALVAAGSAVAAPAADVVPIEAPLHEISIDAAPARMAMLEQPTAAAPAPDQAKVEEAKATVPDTPKGFFHGWKGGVEVGLNGSEGNSENFNLHAGINAERKTERYDTKASLSYLRASDDGETTKNRAELNIQNDWIFSKGSPWRYFVKGTLEYDDFQDWNERLTLTNGIGYAFVENEKTTLIGRVGAGIRKDFGGSDNRLHPEGLLGVDLSHKFTQRQQLTVTAEFFPDFLDLNEYRARLKAGYEILVDPETKLSLKVGVEDRYDSDPGADKKKNDVDYFLLLVWSF